MDECRNGPGWIAQALMTVGKFIFILDIKTKSRTKLKESCLLLIDKARATDKTQGEFYLFYYESMKRKLLKPIYECRCNGRLQTRRVCVSK